MSQLKDTPEYKALEAHFAEMKDVHMRDLFAADPARFDAFSLEFKRKHKTKKRCFLSRNH